MLMFQSLELLTTEEANNAEAESPKLCEGSPVNGELQDFPAQWEMGPVFFGHSVGFQNKHPLHESASRRIA